MSTYSGASPTPTAIPDFQQWMEPMGLVPARASRRPNVFLRAIPTAVGDLIVLAFPLVFFAAMAVMPAIEAGDAAAGAGMLLGAALLMLGGAANAVLSVVALTRGAWASGTFGVVLGSGAALFGAVLAASVLVAS